MLSAPAWPRLATGPRLRAPANWDSRNRARCWRAAAAAVTGDTGVMHMATAIGTPVVALFGPTVEAFGFFPYRARATVLQRDLGCRPCSAKGTLRCPLVHHRCLKEITPAEVELALTELGA